MRQPYQRPASLAAYEPQNVSEGYALAQYLSKSGMLGKDIKTAEQALTVMIAGRELGFTAMQSLRAIYIVEGRLFQVEELDFDGRKAYVRNIDCDYYTDAITYTKVTTLETFANGDGSPDGFEGKQVHTASHGEVHVSSRVVGFKKIKFYTNENVGSGELDLPEQQMHTTSYWLTIPSGIMTALPYSAADRRDG